MLKEITEPQLIITNGVMTGTTVLTSVHSQVKYKDEVAYQFNFTGNPTGSFAVQGSLDFVPTKSQAGNTPMGGNWTTIPVTDSAGNPPVAAGAASTILCRIGPNPFPYLRVVYTNSSGTGVLNAYMGAKSY